MANSSIMSSLSSAGLGTGAGLDVAGTVSQLIAAIRAPDRFGHAAEFGEGAGAIADSVEYRSYSTFECD